MSTSRTRVVVALPLFVALGGCHSGPDPELIRTRTEYLYGPGPSRLGTPGNGQAPQETQRPSAEDVLRQPSLDLYLRYGLHENAALRSSYERWRAALERIPQVSSLPDPTFSFTQFVEEVQTRTGPQERRYSLSQTFPWFGKLSLRGDVATGAAEQTWQKVIAVRLSVERDITVAFFEYGYLAQSIRITRGVIGLLRQLEPVVQRRIAGGTSGQEDLLRLQVEIGRIENDLASLEKVRPALSARLAAAMNWRRRELLPLPELQEPTLGGASVEALIQRAEQLNPELRELAERIRTNRKALDLAELEKWPDLTLGVDYFETGDALTPTPGSGDDPWGLRLMFNLPIWRSKYAAAER